MESLWKKELTPNGSMYVDLLKHLDSSQQITLPTLAVLKCNKSNAHSSKFRSDGNNKFREKQFVEAMELYNRSLCYAECGTELVAYAYANRASCFIKMEKYAEALIDIDLAENANYPEHLMPKLDQRRAECIQLIKAQPPRKRIEPTLSFDANGRIPGMANVLDIRQNEKFGRYIAAKCEIAVSKTILVQNMFVSGWRDIEQTTCANCFKSNANFTPCPKCSTYGSNTMYCSNKCMLEDTTHDIVCKELPITGKNMELFTRLLLIADRGRRCGKWCRWNSCKTQ